MKNWKKFIIFGTLILFSWTLFFGQIFQNKNRILPGFAQNIFQGKFTIKKADQCPCEKNEECFGGFCCGSLGCQNNFCQANNLSEAWYYCINDKKPVFKWKSEVPFAKIELQVSTSPQDFSSAALIFDSKEIEWSQPQFPLSVHQWESLALPSWKEGYPEYGKTYFWRLKLGDSLGNWSLWSEPKSFNLPSHSFPKPDFSWLPSTPSFKEEVEFKDKTIFDKDAKKSWNWIIPEAKCVFKDECPCELYPNCQNPKVIFTSPGVKYITLKATDTTLFEEDSYFGCGAGCCKITKGPETGMTIQLPLPLWKEAIPR